MSVRTRRFAIAAAVVAAYVVAGRFGLSLAEVHPSASAVWPPTGVAIAALLLGGTRLWPAIALGAFLVNVTTSSSVLASLLIATGNTLEAVVGARLTEIVAGGRSAFRRPLDVLRFVAVAGLAATAISASVGTTALVLTGLARAADAGPIWVTWWLGDASGAVIVTPLLVLWAGARVRDLRRGRVLQAAALAASIALFGTVLFSGLTAPSVDHVPLHFFAFPLLAWAAFAFGPLGAATAAAALEAIAISGTLAGYGPFAGGDRATSLLLLQSFGMTASATALALAAAILERQRAEERVADTERRLREVAQQAALAREEFLAIATHELRTPVTSLSGFAQLALRALDAGTTDRLRPALMTIVRQSERLSALISQLLDASRIERGRLPIERARTDVSALVTTAVDAARLRVPTHGFRTEIARGLVANVDPLRWEQVVTNLVDNATRYSAPGTTVGVRLASDGRVLRLDVTDEGVGIAPENVAFVFDRFYRAQEGGSGGLGLGLYITREIVDRHGGEIGVASTPGSGSTFTVTIPAVPAAPSDPRPTPRRAVAPDRTAHGTVLVVDDDLDVRALAVEVLRDAGCEVLAATNGQEALAVLAARTPDLILLDKLMPVMDGATFAAAYRARAAEPAPIIAFCAARDVAEWAAAVGAVAYVPKPFDVEQLESVVLDRLRERAAGA